ncbi:UDP-2,4-diacetamido-2,4,6-trideoxy-beta-L-altropyranose hydrolase [Paenibacillus sp. LMG 31461]|uniref:UDP-2,4-diacetamido-2,4, 6-trideoxy-beta-L-altropyranose hydrolase n=1 Tax=Paenibacillus plantarum TaxID=2654975 RepID=A0ABX1XE28_9BACL|nr:UDP-2,4-diacetamido-2,4,6-trideoxy-beta-L-altropyranose hydrolase [Paenibacillus plantarum]NOU66730.1 UDP-2,4-diacetamido-2,4,6-trideoxy-beta-L-altropyranose hydrolase [Paenibacillus plantarum]
MNPKIIFRVDASTAWGIGHFIRCLTLAKYFKMEGTIPSFICRYIPVELQQLAEAEDFAVYKLFKVVDWETDARETMLVIDTYVTNPDWIIVDHYHLDARWEKKLRASASNIAVIDDLANRLHDCDVLLDQNYYLNMESRYLDLVSKSCKLLLGPQYALLRPEFIKSREMDSCTRDGSIRRILVFFGGSDPTEETIKTLQAIGSLQLTDLLVDVVVGAANPQKEAIRELCSEASNITYHYQIDYMADLMAKADLAIGAGGTAMWERSILGLPAIVTIVADNQREPVQALETTDTIWNLGWYEQVLPSHIAQTLTEALHDPKMVLRKSKACYDLMDAAGGRHPLVTAILGGSS